MGGVDSRIGGLDCNWATGEVINGAEVTLGAIRGLLFTPTEGFDKDGGPLKFDEFEIVGVLLGDESIG
jgi:hypothetical protein